MRNTDIIIKRLSHQGLAGDCAKDIGALVGRFGALQGQDCPGARWSIGLRLPEIDDQDVEQAICDGTIVRTWAFRGALHLFNKTDVSWALSLIAPRMIARFAVYYPKVGLDQADFPKCYDVIAKSLQGGNQLLREELCAALEAANISMEGNKIHSILQRAALERFICLGPPREKKDTYVLFDEWIPKTEEKERDEALAELARRYFISRGPATLQDYVWWSGLNAPDARRGVELAKDHLRQEVCEGQIYWMSQKASRRNFTGMGACLLPSFDAYLLSYKDRAVCLAPECDKKVDLAYSPFKSLILVDGKIVGIWRKVPWASKLVIEARVFAILNKRQNRDLHEAAVRYGRFIGQPTQLQQAHNFSRLGF